MQRVVSTLAVIALFLFSRVLFADDNPQDAEKWKKVEETFKDYYKQIDSDLHFAVVKSRRLEKYLPDWRVYVRVADTEDGRSNLFLVNRNGTVSDLGWAVMRGDLVAKRAECKPIAEFLKSQKIAIKNRDEAIEFGK